MAKAIGYVVIQSMGYSDTRADYAICKNRAAVEAELLDFGYMQNPGVFVYIVTRGQTADTVIDALVKSHDPYPDYVVERGPRGGVRWERA